MPRIIGCIFFIVLVCCGVSPGQTRVVTTTPNLADITRNVGGSHVQVQSIMRGPENAHHVAAKPSHMLKLRKADLFVHTGLDAEPWVELLIKGARRAHLLTGQGGNVDVSRGVRLIEVPRRTELTRAFGDIHVHGNTHYSLDPLNGVVIARNITDALKRADPNHAEQYEANYEAYAKRLRDLSKRLTAKLKPYRGTPVAVYHRTWPYFLKRFGLVRTIEIEPKPGIAPGPWRLAQSVSDMQAAGVKVVIVATYDHRKNAQFVARRAGARVVPLAQEVRAIKDVDSYEKLFEHNAAELISAFKAAGIKPKDPDDDVVATEP